MISESANQLIADFEAVMTPGNYTAPDGPVFAGVDLGTANIVTAVVDSQGKPVAGVLTRSDSSVRDGLILDYVGSMTILRQQIRHPEISRLSDSGRGSRLSAWDHRSQLSGIRQCCGGGGAQGGRAHR